MSNIAGISSIGTQIPPLALPLDELASVRGVDPAKYRIGLGCSEMALCPEGYGVVDLLVGAAERALQRWDGDPEQIGLLVVGTETAMDMSRPLSAWVADRLGLSGAIRSYEVKHACYGGTLALRQALEWKWSGASRGQAALVISGDVALYGTGDPGEPTQGAGAVAMVVDQPTIAQVSPQSFAWSEPAFDFWRPVGETYPRVDGPFSLECYKKAAAQCFGALLDDPDVKGLDDFAAICFHVPFPKMVKKAFFHVAEGLGLGNDHAERFFITKIEPIMGWNRRIGNAYTASLWIAVAEALAGMDTGETLAAFSYGSGFGSELLTLRAGADAAGGAWQHDMEQDLTNRRWITGREYSEWRAETVTRSTAAAGG